MVKHEGLSLCKAYAASTLPRAQMHLQDSRAHKQQARRGRSSDVPSINKGGTELLGRCISTFQQPEGQGVLLHRLLSDLSGAGAPGNHAASRQIVLCAFIVPGACINWIPAIRKFPPCNRKSSLHVAIGSSAVLASPHLLLLVLLPIQGAFRAHSLFDRLLQPTMAGHSVGIC